jgi:hypothetical protein
MLLKPKTRSAGASLKREDERLSRSGWWPWIYACLTVPVTGLPSGPPFEKPSAVPRLPASLEGPPAVPKLIFVQDPSPVASGYYAETGPAVTDPLRPSPTPLHQRGKVRSGHRGHQYSTSASNNNASDGQETEYRATGDSIPGHPLTSRCCTPHLLRAFFPIPAVSLSNFFFRSNHSKQQSAVEDTARGW